MSSNNASPLRVGIVGAGDNTRRRHIPGLKAIPGVQITGVVNSSAESSARVASEFQIPKVYPDWKALVNDPAIDAVVIGTWPNLHCEVTCAALKAGKHVLCEARMARNLAEARQMKATADAHPDRVAMLVPSPMGLVVDREVRQLLHDGYIGDLREVMVFGADDQFYDYSQFLHWRQDRDISGVNVLTLGILQETLLRWVPQATRVFAQSQTFEPVRPNPVGPGNRQVTVPDSVQILTQLPNRARGLYHFSGVDVHGMGKQIHLYGTAGTIKVVFGEKETLYAGRVGQEGLREITIPAERLGEWRVEAEFIGAIRGSEAVQRTTFPDGLKYMEFSEAVDRSATTSTPVDLPLA
ncbi:Gfo/Idh/MocA family protein [Schlesneria sp. T3-172]|uniref:Gfo/Idh/MocA family protein n=1 Tax=Schlesneria sphaerica TaxID=3373610 RepID=UPI0037C712B9